MQTGMPWSQNVVMVWLDGEVWRDGVQGVTSMVRRGNDQLDIMGLEQTQSSGCKGLRLQGGWWCRGGQWSGSSHHDVTLACSRLARRGRDEDKAELSTIVAQ